MEEEEEPTEHEVSALWRAASAGLPRWIATAEAHNFWRAHSFWGKEEQSMSKKTYMRRN